MPVSTRLQWQRDSADWPHREASRFVAAGGVHFHLQQLGPALGARPVALLLHGTGASTHSWRDFAPLLLPHYTVLMLDLPGHAFSSLPAAAQMSLPGMARAIGALLHTLGVVPALVVGHSAGAAIAAQMALTGSARMQVPPRTQPQAQPQAHPHDQPRAIASLNGAWLPLGGVAGRVFSPVAKLMAGNPLVPRLFSWRAQDASAVARLIDGTGSKIDAAGMRQYGRLVANPGHVAGALSMMANWDLAALQAQLPALAVPVLLLTGSNDRTVPPAQAAQVAGLLPHAREQRLAGLGHLAHEEQPALVARAVLDFAAEQGLPGAQ